MRIRRFRVKLLTAMRCSVLCPRLLLVCLLWQSASPVWSADNPPESNPPATILPGSSSSVSVEALNVRLKEVETSTSLDDETRAQLVETINKALANLETARTSKANTEEFIRLRETAPAQIKAIRTVLDKAQNAPVNISITATRESPFDEIERELLQEKANLAAVEAKRADLVGQLEAAKARPTKIPGLLATTRQTKEDLESEQEAPAPSGELAWKTEARRWAQTTRLSALRSDISMLDQELLSLPFHVDLLEAQRDQQALTVERINARVKLLEELSGRQGRVEAREAAAAADAAVNDAAGKHPLIQKIAADNSRLTREITAIASTLKRTDASDESVDRDTKRIEDDFRRARAKLEVAGLSDVLGEVMQRQRQSLPEQGKLRRKLSSLENEHASISLDMIQQSGDLGYVANAEEYVVELTRELENETATAVRDDLVELTNTRRDLLDKSINLHKSYLRSLNELSVSYRQLLDTSSAYNDFLAKNLLWIRSAPEPTLRGIADLPAEVSRLFSPPRWRDIPVAIINGVLTSTPVKFLLGLFVVLLWKGQYLHRQLVAMGEPVGKVATDKFSYTLKALGLTLLRAVHWPLLMATVGMALVSGPNVSQLSEQVSGALLQIAPTFFYIQFFSVLCVPGGVAVKHFRWSGGLPRALYTYFYRLKIILLPAIFVLFVAIDEDQTTHFDNVERISMVFALLVIALFFYRLSRLLLHQSDNTRKRQRYFWLGLTVAAPLVLALLAFIGYFYTAGTLGAGLIQTLWISFGLVVLHQIVVRWLLVTQRRLALQAAQERLKAASEDEDNEDAEMEGIHVQVEEPEIDLVALSEETRKLISMMLVIVGFIGFWFVWSDIMPAFNVLDEVTLWHKSSVIAGEEVIVPVSLGEVSIALLIAYLTVVAMKRLPPLLEILLLQRVNMTPGSRYTAKTLTTYAIVGIGLIAFFNVIGMDWSRVQWLFAALSVGIGFGLQEIVANFISGLIILFERPIRVGDVVTVGDTEGAVSRIQIRATTIRTWNGQELLVPNKEFITGRLLNWSLSDQITRINIPVGVAYGSDVQLAMKLMDDSARQNDTILDDPAPYVVFNGFGDDALQLELRCFVGVQGHRIPAVTFLHEEINRKFSEAGIRIAFPQRNVHLNTSIPLDVHIHRDDGHGSGA